MAIYEQPVRILIKEMIHDLTSGQGTIFSRTGDLGWFEKHYPKVKKGTIDAHLVRFSTNAVSRLHHNIRPEEDLLFQN